MSKEKLPNYLDGSRPTTLSEMIAWYCQDCSWTSCKVSLTDPIEHETQNPSHKVNPTAKTALEWLGKI